VAAVSGTASSRAWTYPGSREFADDADAEAIRGRIDTHILSCADCRVEGGGFSFCRKGSAMIDAYDTYCRTVKATFLDYMHVKINNGTAKDGDGHAHCLHPCGDASVRGTPLEGCSTCCRCRRIQPDVSGRGASALSEPSSPPVDR